MESDFWYDRWQRNGVGSHEDEANALLVESFSALCLEEGDRIFLPLCGRTRDIVWLRSRDYHVAWAELSPLSVGQLFTSLDIEPRISDLGSQKHYSADGIDIFAGDIFDLSSHMLSRVDAIYDRAALVALSKEKRERLYGLPDEGDRNRARTSDLLRL